MPSSTAHIWDGRPPALQSWPAYFGYIIWLAKALWYLARQPPGTTPTLYSSYAALASPQYVWMPDDGIPILLLAWPPSPPIYISHKSSPTVQLSYKKSPATVPLPPSSSPPSPPPPTTSVIYGDSDTRPPSCYCYRWMYGPGMESPQPSPEDLRSRW